MLKEDLERERRRKLKEKVIGGEENVMSLDEARGESAADSGVDEQHYDLGATGKAEF